MGWHCKTIDVSRRSVLTALITLEDSWHTDQVDRHSKESVRFYVYRLGFVHTLGEDGRGIEGHGVERDVEKLRCSWRWWKCIAVALPHDVVLMDHALSAPGRTRHDGEC